VDIDSEKIKMRKTRKASTHFDTRAGRTTTLLEGGRRSVFLGYVLGPRS
jgi:hypothetical protein